MIIPKMGISEDPSLIIELLSNKVEQLESQLAIAVKALRACDIALKAAKPCVNGGEHMNDKIAEKALALLKEYNK